jgi:hypothetical protein
MNKLTMGSLIAVVLTTPLGCSVDRRAEVEPGEYIVIDIHSESNIATITGIETLVVERESNTIVIELEDGSQLVTMFVSRKKQDWPAGCPSNIGST